MLKKKKKGRKLFTYHARNRRVFSPYHPMRTAVGTVLTLAAVVVLGFVGYNIVGPVVTRMSAEAESPTTTPEPYVFETEPAVTEVTVLTASTEMLTTTSEMTVTTVETTSSAQPLQTRFPEGITVAAFAPEDALRDLTQLDAAAEQMAKDGYTAMILPMKATGGQLGFYSENEQARTCGATNADLLTVREIRNAAGRWNLQCVGMFSTLEDHIYPSYFMDGSYTFKDGTTRWLDGRESEGGKPWLNPFSQAAREYLAALAEELHDGGFSQILCTNTVFPHFYQSDIEYLGAQVADPNRRTEALTGVLNAMADQAPETCIYTDLWDVISGKDEAFQAQALRTAACVRIDFKQFEQPFTAAGERFDPSSLAYADRVTMLLQAADDAVGNLSLYPCIVTGDLTEDELDTAIEAAAAAGYDMVFVTEN